MGHDVCFSRCLSLHLAEHKAAAWCHHEQVSSRATNLHPNYNMVSNRATNAHPNYNMVSNRATNAHPNYNMVSNRATNAHRDYKINVVLHHVFFL